MFLVTFRSIADSTFWLGLSFLSLVLSCTVMYRMAKDLKNYDDGTGTPPDGKFGFTPDELKEWYDEMGEEGCQVYIRQAKMDLFPFIFCYIIFLGATLVHATRFAGNFFGTSSTTNNDAVAYILGITLVSDIIETTICLRGCQMYPQPLEPDILYQIASLSNQTKWVSLAITLIIIPILFISGAAHNSGMDQTQHQSHGHRSATFSSKKH